MINNIPREPVMNKSQIPVAQKEVLGLLLDDHKKAKKLFKDFENEKSEAAKEKIAREVCRDLTAHTTIEEEIFYPFLREQNPEAFGDLLNEALVEHASAKELISQLQIMSSKDELFEANFTVLGEFTNHHITEEEDELFPKVIEKDIDLRSLEQPMQETKEEVLANSAAV